MPDILQAHAQWRDDAHSGDDDTTHGKPSLYPAISGMRDDRAGRDDPLKNANAEDDLSSPWI
jgi:hypothetical protein